jgi:hypothetical protein
MDACMKQHEMLFDVFPSTVELMNAPAPIQKGSACLAVMGEPSETSKYCSSHSAPPLEGVFLSLFYCFTIVNMLLFFVLLVFIGDRLLPIPVATQGLEPMDARVGEREHV